MNNSESSWINLPCIKISAESCHLSFVLVSPCQSAKNSAIRFSMLQPDVVAANESMDVFFSSGIAFASRSTISSTKLVQN